MPLVLGVDSSTQSTKALLVDADDGTVVAQRTAPHPAGTEVDPRAWLGGGRRRRPPGCSSAPTRSPSAASSTAWSPSTTHGEPVRDALLWNDTRSAPQAADPDRTSSAARRRAPTRSAACWSPRSRSPSCAGCATTSPTAPRGSPRCCSRTTTSPATCPRPAPTPFTDRGDASGTGYFATREGDWRPDLAKAALGHEPRAAARRRARRRRRPHRRAVSRSARGTGDNMARRARARPAPRRRAGLDRHLRGRVDASAAGPIADGTGVVTGFADATGRLPADGHDDERRRHPRPPGRAARRRPRRAGRPRARRAARRERRHAAALLRRRAHPQPPGRRRHLDRPHPAHHPRRPRPGRVRGAALLARRRGGRTARRRPATEPRRVLLVGGAARSPAVRALAPAILGRPVLLPPPGEYVALGAARQAAWALVRRRRAPGLAAARHRDARGRPDPRRTRALRRAPRPHRT